MIEALIKIAIVIGGLMTAAAYFVLLERRMAAWVQDRVGPNRVGAPLSQLNKGWKDLRLFGLGQPAADGVKFILKEEYTPAHVDKRLFVLAPISILVAALATFAVIPFGSILPPGLLSDEPIALVISPGAGVGMLVVFALSSIAVYGVILGGWASNNKYSFLGALRSSAQLIAYELPLGLGILGVILATGSLDLDKIISAQAETGWWFAFTQPLGFFVFFVAAFAEAARLPFDLPECEQELIGGYHTEYSGIKLLLFLVAEFLHMIAASFLIVMLFFGGWHFWFITGADANPGWVQAILRVAVLMTKIFLVILFFMLVRWSWPRFRFDQLMAFAWKVMLPLGLINFVAVAAIDQFRTISGNTSPGMDLLCVAVAWVICIVAWVGISFAGPLVADNRPRADLNPFDIDSQI
ncbi:MAG: NADH-quinone oxidoreductase subunit NuoH [Planctomycetaceae bacterium]|nr:NADH-quinone oxidoreductase subunit NuoH [Planctomycetaceae bacterium]